MEMTEWNKPVIVFYVENIDDPKTEPFAVIKAKKLIVNNIQQQELTGRIIDFFTLMGDIDYVSSPEGKKDHYVICWFDDAIEDFSKSFRKLNGVTFPSGLLSVEIGEKRTYTGSFQAKHGKLH